MMVPLAIVVLTFLIQFSWGYNEDMYPLSENLDSYIYPDDFQDEPDFEVHRRNNNNFLRFGRSGHNEYDDYNNEGYARPTRSGKIEKNDHFIRFGRSKQDFLRFGRDQPRNSNYLRFGRSAEEKRRNKRDTAYEMKRGGSNFLRFGRNSNFLRFGRNEITATVDPEKARFQETPLIHLLSELVENIKKEQNKSNRIV